jgi:chitodextrinase
MTAQSQITPVRLDAKRPAGDRMQELGATIAKAVRADLAELEKRFEARLDAMARRCNQLQAELTMVKDTHPSWRGVWKQGATYPVGSFATHNGGLWVATSAAPAGDRPGQSPAWRLCVKRGKGDLDKGDAANE